MYTDIQACIHTDGRRQDERRSDGRANGKNTYKPIECKQYHKNIHTGGRTH